MIKAVLLAFIVVTAVTASASAKTVASADVKVSLVQVTDVFPLVQKPGLQVSVAVEDLGGSTDLSPTMNVYLTLYAKGEMFTTHATFKIASVLSVQSAKRVSGGIYQVVALTYDEDAEGIQEKTFTIDAIKAVNAIQAVQCEDFDCEASSNFVSEVEVTTTSKKAH